jgi:UDP-3-O-[3-hydroxymyristoyl] glucosamine N-acyltransferase
MKFDKAIPVKEIANRIGATLLGDENILATGINEIHKVTPGDISFVDFEKYYNVCLQSAATIIIINKAVEVPNGKALLVVDDPFSAYTAIVKDHRPFIPATAMVSEDAIIGAGTVIQPGVSIAHHVQIGKNCIIHPNVTIYEHTIIGDNVIIHANSVIGADAFYFKRRSDRELMHDKMLSCGRVIIENDVEIGACCTIDKGVSGDTIIGAGSKFDNMVHVGHGVVIGKNGLFAAQVGIGGKVIIEDNVTLWGQVGVQKDLRIEKGVSVLGKSGVGQTLKAGKTYFGAPAEEALTKKKELAWIKRIPEMWAMLKK